MRENDLATNLTFSSCSTGFLNNFLLSLGFLHMLSNTIDLPSTCVCVHAQSCLTLCNLMNCSLPSSSVRGIFQARILEWVAISSSRASYSPRVEPMSPAFPALASGFFTTGATWEAHLQDMRSKKGAFTCICAGNFLPILFVLHDI